MPLWKNRDTDTDGAKPLFVAGDPHVDTLNVIATNEGWVHRRTYTDTHSKAREKNEVLVAINRLAGAENITDAGTEGLAAATIVDVRFTGLQVAAGGTSNLIVTYNEEVYVTGNPTLAIAATATSANTSPISVTYTYASGNGTNRLTFSGTMDANQAFYTIGENPVVLAGGTIKDKLTFTANSDLTIPAALAGANSVLGVMYSNT
jgi:hypothetical protein